MTIERLKKILDYKKNHTAEIDSDISSFCSMLELPNLDGFRNVFEIVKLYLKEKKYYVIRFPLKDDEIGAFVYKGDVVSYLVINTTVPVGNTNFAFCHELYHIYFPDIEDEMRANQFAANLLMPYAEFRRMFLKFKSAFDNTSETEEEKQLNVIIFLMNYFNVPFMAAYIRCYEFDLLKGPVKFLDIKKEIISLAFDKLWFDKTLLEPSRIDDSKQLMQFLKETGKEYAERGYISSRTLEKALDNTKKLFTKIKAGE